MQDVWQNSDWKGKRSDNEQNLENALHLYAGQRCADQIFALQQVTGKFMNVRTIIEYYCITEAYIKELELWKVYENM